MFIAILEILTIPLIFLNFGGGIIGGIWLAFLGEWKLIVIGLLLLFTAPWILSIFMMPGILISGFTAHFQERKFLTYFLTFLSQLYTNILVVATCFIAFFICSSFYQEPIGLGYIPYALWSWGMALGPWKFFASHERDNPFTGITVLSASIFYFLFLASIFISPFLASVLFIIFAIAQLIVLPITIIFLANKME